jgi:hypothetical protein
MEEKRVGTLLDFGMVRSTRTAASPRVKKFENADIEYTLRAGLQDSADAPRV